MISISIPQPADQLPRIVSPSLTATMIAEEVLRGNIPLARDYAEAYARFRDDILTFDEMAAKERGLYEARAVTA